MLIGLEDESLYINIMLIYFFVFSLSYAFIYYGYKYEKIKMIFLLCNVMAILVPALLAGFRDPTVGHDLLAYAVPTFENMSDTHTIKGAITTMFASDLEPGYILYILGVKLFSDELFYFFFVQQVIVLSLISFTAYRFRKNLDAPLLYCSYLFFFFCSSMSANRQVFAVSIIFFAFYYVGRRNLLKFSVCIVIATLFHYSAILGMSIYLMEFLAGKIKKDIAFHRILYFIISGCLIYIFFPIIISSAISNGFLASKYTKYIDSEFNTHKIDLMCVISWYFISYIQKGQYIFNKRIKLLCVLTFFMLLCGVYNDVAQRVALYVNLYLFVILFMKAHDAKVFLKKKITFFTWGLILVRWLYLGLTTSFAESIPYTSVVLGIK